MAVLVRHPIGNRAAIDNLASNGNLVSNVIYHISDEDRIAIATSSNTYQTFAKEGEGEGGGGGGGGSVSESSVISIAKGASIGLEQSLLASSGQPARTVLAVGYTNTGRVQGVSLGDGNVVEVYASGSDFSNNIVLYREFMSLGEPIIFTGLDNGAIITSTQGFYGMSEQTDNSGNRSPMPLLSLGLSFTFTFMFAFRGSGFYGPTSTNNSQGWVHVVNGPLTSSLAFKDGTGNVIRGQENIELAPWAYHRLYTDGDQEYIIESTNSIMACHNANMGNDDGTGLFWDSRLIMPLTNDGITWPRSGNVSAPFVNTSWSYYVRDGATGVDSTSPGSPTNFATATGANDADYEPNGATRVRANGLISAYSGADSAGLEASPMMPVSGMSQIVAQPFFIIDSGDGGVSGVSIASPYVGTARVYEWDELTQELNLAYTVPLTRNGVNVTTIEDQYHPSAGMVANETVNGAVNLQGDLRPGIVVADVPITVVAQSIGSSSIMIRSQNGGTEPSIDTNADETLLLGHTPEQDKAVIRKNFSDGLLYKEDIQFTASRWNEA